VGSGLAAKSGRRVAVNRDDGPPQMVACPFRLVTAHPPAMQSAARVLASALGAQSVDVPPALL